MTDSFEGGSLAQLFATPVWIFKPTQGLTLAERLGRHLRQLRAADPTWIAAPSERWQSRDDLHKSAELAELVALAHEASRAALSLAQLECELKITGLWGNISCGSEALHDHTHPNNYLSGVFYVRMPEGAGAITFKDPRPQTRILRPRALRDTPLNALELDLATSEGTLLLFPAWLEHGVRPSRAADERITIAFNMMITGPLGTHEQLAYSEL